MANELDQAILAASEKDFKGFEDNLNKALSQKMQQHLKGYMSYVEKNSFKKEE